MLGLAFSSYAGRGSSSKRAAVRCAFGAATTLTSLRTSAYVRGVGMAETALRTTPDVPPHDARIRASGVAQGAVPQYGRGRDGHMSPGLAQLTDLVAWNVLKRTNPTCYDLLRSAYIPGSTPEPQSPDSMTSFRGSGCRGAKVGASARNEKSR